MSIYLSYIVDLMIDKAGRWKLIYPDGDDKNIAPMLTEINKIGIKEGVLDLSWQFRGILDNNKLIDHWPLVQVHWCLVSMLDSVHGSWVSELYYITVIASTISKIREEYEDMLMYPEEQVPQTYPLHISAEEVQRFERYESKLHAINLDLRKVLEGRGWMNFAKQHALSYVQLWEVLGVDVSEVERMREQKPEEFTVMSFKK